MVAPLSLYTDTHTEVNITGWQVFRGPCYSKGVSVLAWPTRCLFWSLPALPGTLTLYWHGQTEMSLDGKGRTAHNTGEGQSNLQAGKYRYNELQCCVWWSCEKKSVPYQSLYELPSCSYHLPARLTLSSPARLILPSPF